MNYYHGTIIGNDKFSESHNAEESSSRDGACIYLTSDISDAAANYASPYSNDNRAKICIMIDRGLINQTVMECADYMFLKHSPKVLTCSVKYSRPFISSDKVIGDNQPEYKNLKHSISEFLVNKGVYHDINREVSDLLSEMVCRKKTSQEILSYLRFEAINDASSISDKIKGTMGRNTSFSPCLFGRFDAIIDRCAGDEWNVKKGTEHIILMNKSKVKVLDVRVIKPNEALLLKKYHCQPVDPHKPLEAFDCHKVLNWRFEPASEPELNI